jgi:hypothetical protein
MNPSFLPNPTRAVIDSVRGDNMGSGFMEAGRNRMRENDERRFQSEQNQIREILDSGQYDMEQFYRAPQVPAVNDLAREIAINQYGADPFMAQEVFPQTDPYENYMKEMGARKMELEIGRLENPEPLAYDDQLEAYKQTEDYQLSQRDAFAADPNATGQDVVTQLANMYPDLPHELIQELALAREKLLNG